MPKDSIKDNLDGNELDLSLNNLSVVPVKELSAIPKATHLDLSCNVLTSLPDGFCNLTHLVKIDLSKNHLASLPTKFGSLVNLQHLDLLGNQLEKLPFSFCHLQRLKWLDLKDNPLDTGLKGAAGDCLDEAQCRKCAKNVLLYMKQVAADAERRKQKQLLEAREREAAAKRKEEEERLKKKAEKKAEKERRKQQHQAKRDLEVKEQVEDIAKDSDEAEICNGPSTKTERVKSSKSCFGGCCFWLFTLLALLLAVGFGAHFHCTSSKPHELCKTHYQPVRHFTVAKYHETRNIVEDFIEKQFGQKADSKSSSKKNTKKGNVKQ